MRPFQLRSAIADEGSPAGRGPGPRLAGAVVGQEDMIIEVAAGPTCTEAAAAALPAKFASPLYAAVTACVATESEETGSCALPFESSATKRVLTRRRTS